MARVRNDFSMQVGPEQAQSMFLRDIAPELARDGSFFLKDEQPGLLVFSDGIPDPGNAAASDEAEDVLSGEETFPDMGRPLRPASVGFRLGGHGQNAPRDPVIYKGLRRLAARRIKVQFEAAATGTTVTVSGSAERLIARGLGRLGGPGHWPETANDPHD